MLKRLLILSVLLAASSNAFANTILLDRIVAIVNDDVVMASELQKAVQELQNKLIAANTTPMPAKSVIARKALDQLVIEKLMLEKAEEEGIIIDERVLSDAVRRVAKNNGITLSQLRQMMASEGVDFNAFREGIRKQIILARLRNQVINDTVQVSKAEVDQYMHNQGAGGGQRNAVHLHHILVSTPDGATPEEIARAKQKATSLYQMLQAGHDFAQTAQTHSHGQRALNGGDLGWLDINQVPSLFTDQVARLPKGGIAPPVQSKSGFHIIRLHDYQGEDRRIVDQTFAHHILIKTDEVTSDEDAENRLWQLRDRIQMGESFANLAKSNSQDTGSAIQGGSLGWVNPGVMVDSFEEMMLQTQPGQISSPFKSEFGWHIVYVEDRRQHDATEESMRNEARKVIREQKAKDAMDQYRRRIRDEAYVEEHLIDPERDF